MDLVKKYYEIQKELMALEPAFTDKGKINLVRRKTNEVYEKVADIAKELTQLSLIDKDKLKEILADTSQKVAYSWFIFFSNRAQFRALLTAMHTMGNYLRAEKTAKLLRSFYHGYQVTFSFLPIRSLCDKKASKRVLELMVNIGFITASPVILEDLVNLLITTQFEGGKIIVPKEPEPEPEAPAEGAPEAEGEKGPQEEKPKKSRRAKKGPVEPVISPEQMFADIQAYATEKPEFQQVNAISQVIARGGGNPTGDFHNLMEILSKVKLRYLDNQAPEVGLGWSTLAEEQKMEIDFENMRIFVEASFDDKSMPVFVLEGILYYALLSLMFARRIGKGFEKNPDFIRLWGRFDKSATMKDAISKFKSEKSAESQSIQAADEEFKITLAQQAELERANIAGKVVETDVAIRIGTRTGTTEPIIWAPTDKVSRLSNQHILICGKSGAGKTQSVKYTLFGLFKRKVPCLVCDFHGEYTASAGGDDFQKNTHALVLDAAEGIDLNPLAIQTDPSTGKPYSYVFVSYQVSSVLAKIFKLGSIQESFLKNAISNAFQNVGFDQKDYKTWLRTPPPFSAIWDELIVLESVYGSKVTNLLSRVEPLFETGVFRGSQGSMAQFFAEGQMTIIRLSSLPSEKLRIAVSQFLLEKIYQLMLSLGPTSRQRLFVCIEEAHLLGATERLVSMLKESRKYGIGTILASQQPRDFNTSILSNAGTVISLQLEAEDAKLMSRFLGVTQSKAQIEVMERLMRLSPGQALLRNNRYSPYVPVSMNPYQLVGTGPAKTPITR